jgi:DHA3 family macrolide efflux protein-like MFS transporter
MSPLGMAIAGPVSDALGVRFWFVVAGTVCVLMGIAAAFVPVLMNLENTNGHVAGEAVVPAAVTAE